MKHFDINSVRGLPRGSTFQKEHIQSGMAVKVLFNILIFSAVTFSVSLVIEKYCAGRLKWLTVSVLFLAVAGLLIRPGALLLFLSALTAPFSPEPLGVLLLGGLLSGIFISGVCVFFRLMQALLIKLMS